jgi:hypothetical protein
MRLPVLLATIPAQTLGERCYGKEKNGCRSCKTVRCRDDVERKLTETKGRSNFDGVLARLALIMLGRCTCVELLVDLSSAVQCITDTLADIFGAHVTLEVRLLHELSGLLARAAKQ